MIEFLSDKERDLVEKFVKDDVMREAVRKVILSGVYMDGMLEEDKPADPLKNFILALFTRPGMELLPPQDKGMKLESILHAVSMVESGFEALNKCVKVEPNVGDKKVKGY